MRNPLAALGSIVMVVVVMAFAAAPARADVPPPDLCTSPGQPCQNAGPQYNQSGTCTATTCTKQVPSPDGGMMSMTYDCNLCQVAGADGGPGPKPMSDSGCAVAPRGADSASAGPLILLLAGLVVTAARRRNSRG